MLANIECWREEGKHLFRPPLPTWLTVIAEIDALLDGHMARVSLRQPNGQWIYAVVPVNQLPEGASIGDSIRVATEYNAQNQFVQCVPLRGLQPQPQPKHPQMPARPATDDPAAWSEYRARLAQSFGEE